MVVNDVLKTWRSMFEKGGERRSKKVVSSWHEQATLMA